MLQWPPLASFLLGGEQSLGGSDDARADNGLSDVAGALIIASDSPISDSSYRALFSFESDHRRICSRSFGLRMLAFVPMLPSHAADQGSFEQTNLCNCNPNLAKTNAIPPVPYLT
jgi:hypothetical protein